MTINIIWKRKINQLEELFCVTDSRLSGSFIFNQATKTFVLPRNDSFISFAGSTEIAFTIINHIIEKINSDYRARERILDITDLKSHLIKILPSILENIELYSISDDGGLKDIEFQFGGYSWKHNKFSAWRFRSFAKQKPTYKVENIKKSNGLFSPDPYLLNFVADEMKDSNNFLIAGDDEVVKESLKRLMILKEKNKLCAWDMEPFEIVRDLLRENKFAGIGGAPQLVKTYRNSRTIRVGVEWPSYSDSNQDLYTIGGRYLSEYENVENIIINPDSLNNIEVPFVINSRYYRTKYDL